MLTRCNHLKMVLDFQNMQIGFQNLQKLFQNQQNLLLLAFYYCKCGIFLLLLYHLRRTLIAVETIQHE